MHLCLDNREIYEVNRMDDLISRQAVHDLIIETDPYWAEGMTRAIYDGVSKLPSTQPERKAPVSYKEQLSLDCSFCRQHERGDTLYESSDWDGGIGFDYIRNIRFCPICGRELYDEE